MILTDNEISNLWINAKCNDKSEVNNFARAIEAAILAKLASAELPEPALPKGVGMCASFKLDYFTADQLKAWGNTRYAQGAAAQLAEKPEAYGCRTADGVVRDCIGPDGLFEYETQYTVPLYTRRQA